MQSTWWRDRDWETTGSGYKYAGDTPKEVYIWILHHIDGTGYVHDDVIKYIRIFQPFLIRRSSSLCQPIFVLLIYIQSTCKKPNISLFGPQSRMRHMDSVLWLFQSFFDNLFPPEIVSLQTRYGSIQEMLQYQLLYGQLGKEQQDSSLLVLNDFNERVVEEEEGGL